MTKAEKELDEMKCFVTSAGCMTIEHICTAIRRSRQATNPSEIRRFVQEVKHYIDVFVEDFNYNFPTKKEKSNVEHSDKE